MKSEADSAELIERNRVSTKSIIIESCIELFPWERDEIAREVITFLRIPTSHRYCDYSVDLDIPLVSLNTQ